MMQQKAGSRRRSCSDSVSYIGSYVRSELCLIRQMFERDPTALRKMTRNLVLSFEKCWLVLVQHPFPAYMFCLSSTDSKPRPLVSLSACTLPLALEAWKGQHGTLGPPKIGFAHLPFPLYKKFKPITPPSV